MHELRYRLSFNTPAFLGNAQQQGQWRTPPIKALLRQWWRVVKAKELGYDVAKLLEEEKKLFGVAGEKGSSIGQSRVRFRLEHWQAGREKVPQGEHVAHREVPAKRVAANLYLGYGPLTTRAARDALPPSAVGAREAENVLRIMLARQVEPTQLGEVSQAIELAAWFGGLGSRSRNGFGSMHWEAIDGTAALRPLSINNLPPVTVEFTEALRRDWPHGIGLDLRGQPLIWRTKNLHKDWLGAMKQLAIAKIELRTSPFFEFSSGSKAGHPNPLPRHILAYPAGGQHSVDLPGWSRGGRMANQLRLRVLREEGGFRGIICHLPCGVPNHMRSVVRSMPDERKVWSVVHSVMDDNRDLVRLEG